MSQDKEFYKGLEEAKQVLDAKEQTEVPLEQGIDPQVVIVGVSKQFMPTILKANRGGFIVVIEGFGIAAKSTLEEALAYLGERAYAGMDEHPDLPRHVKQAWEDMDGMGRRPAPPQRTSRPRDTLSTLARNALRFPVKVMQ